MELKDNIKRYRELQNLSVQELADKMRVGKANIYNWENGDNKPDIDSLTLLSKALGVSVNDLLDENPTPVQKGSENKAKSPEETIHTLITELRDNAQYLRDQNAKLTDKLSELATVAFTNSKK
jgi:transcriptional regulator with XRE-family HTH domain